MNGPLARSQMLKTRGRIARAHIFLYNLKRGDKVDLTFYTILKANSLPSRFANFKRHAYKCEI